MVEIVLRKRCNFSRRLYEVSGPKAAELHTMFSTRGSNSVGAKRRGKVAARHIASIKTNGRTGSAKGPREMESRDWEPGNGGVTL
jgi:hypothetical protein